MGNVLVACYAMLIQLVSQVPFGIRWLCKATRALVQEKFPEATAERVNSFIGGFFFLRYINPIIATPHGEYVHVYVSSQSNECLVT